jgi:hypothetical protein
VTILGIDALTGWLKACAVALIAGLTLLATLTAGIPDLAAPTVTRSPVTLKGAVVFGQSTTPGITLVPGGRGIVQAVQQGDVAETVDLGRQNTYSFNLWPGIYTIRAGAELALKRDDFCSQEVRITAGEAMQATLYCTPSEFRASADSTIASRE